ncbi:energy transducer TonB [Siccationidurans soli]|uniref:Energy transducer TonB n=2 Tax=Hymenobacter negativus TaxID=2795026 RepID=A0ABS3QGR0_9BACT|nr:energy transducer TonB [Hymenobacter negativus]
MNNAQLATASLDDIVFDGRNRHYGAYELRALYQRHMTRALIIATAVCALLLVFPLVAQLLKKDVVTVVPPIIVESNPTIIDMPEELKVLPPPPAASRPAVPPPQPPTVQDIVPVVTTDDKVTPNDKVPDQSELVDAKPGLVTQIGEIGADPNASLDDLKIGTGPGGDVTGETVTEKPYFYVEQMPQLPGGGGQAAIVAAIQKAARYPGEALRNQVEGKVFVSFVVNPLGEVTDVKVIKGLGAGLDEETIRAVKTLPRFIPGKQNGRAVSVAYTVPISFKIQ